MPQAREALNKFKIESAQEIEVNIKNGYNRDLAARKVGSIGGNMVKKMVEAYE